VGHGNQRAVIGTGDPRCGPDILDVVDPALYMPALTLALAVAAELDRGHLPAGIRECLSDVLIATEMLGKAVNKEKIPSWGTPPSEPEAGSVSGGGVEDLHRLLQQRQ
jgi:hypothetical protein